MQFCLAVFHSLFGVIVQDLYIYVHIFFSYMTISLTIQSYPFPLIWIFVYCYYSHFLFIILFGIGWMLAWSAKFLRYFFRLWSHGAEIVLSSYFNFQKNDFIKLKKIFLININSVMIWFAFWKKRKRKIWKIFGCTLEFFSLEALLSKINSCIVKPIFSFSILWCKCTKFLCT